MTADDEEVRGEKRGADDDEVREHLDQTARLEDERPPQRRLRALDATPRALLEIAQEAPELDEQDERHEHADRRQAPVVEDVVGESRRADRGRDDREEEHGLRLGEPVVDEPVRRVIAATLRDRSLLDEPRDGDERRVEDRDCEHEQGEKDRRDRGSGNRPARRERERREREPDHHASRVAHEHRCSAARPQVEREEAGAGEPEREREREHCVVLVLGHGVDREVRARDDGKRRREPVHVVEEVEGVRDADEPDQADRPRENVVPDDLDVQAAREHDDRGGDLRCELRDRGEVPEVVDEPGDEDDRDACEDAAELARPLECAGREREQDPRREAREDPDATEQRRRLRVPALVRRDGDEPRARGCAE